MKLTLLVSAISMFLTLCASELQGRVVRVADGDTITVLDSANVQHKVRSEKIDAPEKGQPFGKASGRYLSGLVAGREVRAAWTKRDRYNRILGTVYLDERDINLEMLKAGFAWQYKKYDSTPAESAARAAKRCLWADLDPIPPEQFRHGDHKSGGPRAKSEGSLCAEDDIS